MIITTIVTIIIMKLYETTSYQIENPTFLWKAWTNGPAEDYERHKDRITVLIADDILENCPERLNERERAIVEEILEEGDV